MKQIPEVYELIKTQHIAEIDADTALLRHKKTGARAFVIENDDENKAFAIAFRTPVDNSTGKPHILEHSVLCGSDRYPVKDPFMELAKSSLQTFLNAMTYPDKTVYPVASCNDKDFKNLMSVYLDAVFHPLIYSNKNIFLQEGWHYELENPEAELAVNGVVYNEMKGAFSDPEEVLFRYVQNALYPDTTYAFESGGDPDCIPDLTYQEFLDFHAKYYHPSNSYIFLYGNADMEERLDYMDREYLSHYQKTEPDSGIALQAPFEALRRTAVDYALPEGEEESGRDWVCRAWSLDADMSGAESIAWQVLDRALTGVEGAPLKQALVDAGLGEDVSGGFRGDIRQPYFYLYVKNMARGDGARFDRVAEETLQRIAREGVGEKPLRAAIHSLEFASREADFGGIPKGLVYGLQAMDNWLYDENDPFSGLQYEAEYAFLKENVDKGYFEELITKNLLNNPHAAEVELHAKAGLAAEQEEALQKKLAEKKAALSAEQIGALVREGQELLAWQETDDSHEALATIPKLERADLSGSARELSAAPHSIGGIPVLHHEIFTGHIVYMTLSYDVGAVPEDRLYELSLLRSLMGNMDTAAHGYADLANEVMLVSGGIGAGLNLSCPLTEPGKVYPAFEISLKTLRGELGRALDLAVEMRDTTDYSDVRRLADLLRQLRSRCEQSMIGSAHTAAVSRASSYFSASSVYSEKVDGLDFYRRLCAQSYDEESLKELAGRLAGLAGQIFDDARLTVSVTEDAEGFAEAAARIAERFGAAEHQAPQTAAVPQPAVKNEGIITPGQVNYAALAGDLTKAGFAYSGSLQVLRAILSRDYLWTELRVKGGAYGCMCGFNRFGKGYLVSYRDPHVKETYETYAKTAAYLRDFDPTEREMTDFIIGVIGSFDRPLTPSMWGASSYAAAKAGLTNEMIRKEREEILSTTPETIRGYAGLIEALAAQNCVCTFGSEAALKENAGLFLSVEGMA